MTPGQWVAKSFTPKRQLQMAWGQVIACIFGCPYTLIFTDEPKWVLLLSWWAVVGTALAFIAAAESNAKIEQVERDIEEPVS